MPTKKEYIRECKEIWRKIKASGLSKYEWLETEEGREFAAKGYYNRCPLCEFVHSYAATANGFYCPTCPFQKQYDKVCYDLGYDDDGNYPDEWFEAIEGLKE